LIIRKLTLSLHLFDYNRTWEGAKLNKRGEAGHIACQEDLYLKELVRYIHLNPLRTKLVNHLEALNKYPYCGHPVLAGMGRKKRDWQDVLG